MRLKELKIFVEENKDHPKFKSKIGWRATYAGKLYGDQIRTTPPSEAELVEVINLFLGQAIGVIEVLESESTADVVEVQHGEWKKHFSYGLWHYDCPFCDDGFAMTEDFEINQLPHYCSNCGAKMDGGKET